jgi:hypothetical protein
MPEEACLLDPHHAQAARLGALASAAEVVAPVSCQLHLKEVRPLNRPQRAAGLDMLGAAVRSERMSIGVELLWDSLALRQPTHGPPSEILRRNLGWQSDEVHECIAGEQPAPLNQTNVNIECGLR